MNGERGRGNGERSDRSPFPNPLSPSCLRRASLGLCVVVTSALPLPAAAQTTLRSSGRPSVAVAVAAGELRLDGILNDSIWLKADSITSLRQTEPHEGSEASLPTVVKVLTDGDALIFGIRAEHSLSVPIVAFARERDAALANEDHIKLVLDTYLDGRSGYVFAVNANGARYDALVVNQGEGENPDWDGAWEAATTRDAHGWTAEIRIPIKSILFDRALREWGFNVQRRVQRLQETNRWASPARQFMVTHVSRAGLLTELPVFALGYGISVRPAVTAGGGRTAATSTSGQFDPSLDVTQRLSANTLASLTVNTDFAETDVDTRRTNLTRFPLVFPEKRTFFVEGADIFAFGLGTTDDVRPFFTRRIGLLAGQEVPIHAGLKVSGRERESNFGVLVVRTGSGDGVLDTVATENTLGVLRFQQNVLRQSSVGFIASSGDPLGRRNSWLAGPDLTYQTSHFRGDKNFLVGVWGLAMDRDALTGRKRAFGGRVDYPNDLWDIALTYKWLGDGFDPSLGFVPRPSVQILNFNVNYQPRPRRPILGLHVRQMFNEFENTLVTNLNGQWESYRMFTAPVNWRLESGDRFELNFVPVGERLNAPFEIAENVVIPGGTYRWTRYRAEVGFAAKRPVSAQLTWWFGNFYSGRLDELIATTSWKPSALFILELNATHNVGRLPEGNFTQDVIGTRARVNVSPDLQFSSYVQYDNESRSLGSNSRMRWSFTPLGDLFVVYNHNLQRPVALLGPERWEFISNQLLIKMQYAMRW